MNPIGKATITLLLLLSACWAMAQPVCTMTYYDESAGLSQWRVTQMLQDNDGMIWFSTWNGLDRFDGYDFTNFKSHAGDGSNVPSDRIRDMRSYDGDSIFCQIDKDWFYFNRKDGKFSAVSSDRQQQLDTSLSGRGAKGARNLEVLYTDPHGTSWKVDLQGTLWYQEDHLWKSYPIGRSLSGIKAYMADCQGNLWLILPEGVCMLSFSVNPVQRFQQEKPAMVRCIFKDKSRRYWVATKEDSTLRLFDEHNRLLGYLTPQGTLSSKYTSFGSPVYCMNQSHDGIIWLGSKPDGLFRVTEGNGTFNIHPLKGLLPNDNIYDIKEDAWRRLWIATLGGGVCCLIDPLSERPTVLSRQLGFGSYPDKFKEHLVRYIHITHDNVLLAATTEGLLVAQLSKGSLHNLRFKLHQREAHRKNSLSCNATMDVLEDSKNRIYVSTESGGVNELLTKNLLSDQLEFKHFNQSSGLNSDITLSICEADGQLWILSSNQLMSLQPDTQTLGFYDENFFHQPLNFSEIRPVHLPDGRWLFGLTDGAMTTSSDFIRKSTYVPSIAFVGIDKQGTGIDYAVNHLQTLVMQPDERSLTIFFAALDYVSPSSVNFAFKMGDEDEWNYIGHNRTVSFANMEPGTYQLQIRSSNSDGVWVNNIRTLTIIVRPTFWESWYGQLLLVLIICTFLGGALYTYLYIRRIKHQQHETLEAYLALVNKQHTERENAGILSVEQTEEPLQLAPDDKAFMERVMAFVESHISDADANIGDMADATATSKSSLTRKLKSIVGLTPGDFLREARIKRAAQLLTTTADPVSDIAYRCGFSDPKYFGKCFKASVGLSPSEYRSGKQG